MTPVERACTLLVLRHAKSERDLPDVADHDRPLNERGQRDAPRMGRLAREKHLLPDLIITSTARRARETAAGFVAGSRFGGEVQPVESLYLAAPRAYLTMLSSVGEDVGRVMVVGHNPGVEELVKQLTGQATSMPTAALAEIVLPIARWSELDDSTRGELRGVWRPKEPA